MLKNILPENLLNATKLLRYDDLCEIRLRIGRPVMVNYKNAYYFLGQSGLCNEKNAFVCDDNMLKTVLSKASRYSIYSVNEEIKQGFVTAVGGYRIGIVGEIIAEEGKIITVKNFSSINVRIPHQVAGCAYNISKFVIEYDKKSVLNTLILGSPGTGKTTILRDLCNQIYNNLKDCNILLLDERMEIASCVNGQPQLKVGNATDVISGGKKSYNITNGIRTMAPNVVAVDEIGSVEDIEAIQYAVNCGVSIIATIHSKNIYELSKKPELQQLLKQRAFNRYIEISNNNGKGTIENIFDENLKPVLRFI